jgi:hypothetical protein
LNEDQRTKRSSAWTPLLIVIVVNCLMWAVALVANVVVLHRTGQAARLYPILAGGAAVSVVAVSLALGQRKKTDS